MFQNERSWPHPAITPEFDRLQQALAGRYSLVDELGRGGMGVVFLAREVSLDRLVAIKMLPLALASDPEHRERFLVEARMAARLAHPHIVPIHHAEITDGLAWFAMEYVAGSTLGVRLRSYGPLQLPEALQVIQETAWALAHAHALGVIHRDVKPDNILLDAATSRAVITDFGIAAAGADPVHRHVGVGTPHYLSPEHAAGSAADVCGDIYALGVTAWMALTGRRPFEGIQGAALLATQASAEAPSIRNVMPRLQPVLADAIDRAVARDPAQRFDSMAEFAAVLDQARHEHPEFPIQLRRFARQTLEHSDRLGIALGVGGAATVGVLAIDAFWSGFLGFEIIPYLIVATLAAGSVVLLLAQQLQRVRELARLGYPHTAALRAVTALEAEEDHQLPKGPGWSRNPRVLIALGVWATLWGIWASVQVHNVLFFTAAMMVALLMPAVISRRLARVRRLRGSWWTRLMRGRVGPGFWRVATAGLGRIQQLTVGGEPTAMVVAGMVRALYGELPPAEQQLLGDLPDLAARLERQAQAGDSQRAAQAMAALETLRLDIMRLRAGQIAADGITSDIEKIRELGFYVDAMDEV